MAATATKMPTMTWLSTVAASSSAAQTGRRPPRNVSANTPRKHRAKHKAMVKENSPARVLASVPPMIRWLKAAFANGAVVRGSPRKNRNASVAIPMNNGAGNRSRSPRPKTNADAGSATAPTAVMSLNAMLYGSTTSSSTIINAGIGK